jgi:hypothetical protein
MSKLDFDKTEMPEPTEIREDKAEIKFKPTNPKRIYLQITDGVRFDPMTGKRMSNDFIQSFTEEEFTQFDKMAKAIGYTYIILYRPTYAKK